MGDDSIWSHRERPGTEACSWPTCDLAAAGLAFEARQPQTDR